MTLRALERLKDLYCDIAQVIFFSLIFHQYFQNSSITVAMLPLPHCLIEVPLPQNARLRRHGKYLEVCLPFL